MTSFQYWADQMPDGYFMCTICFHMTPIEDAVTDPKDGLKCDICPDCEHEAFGD